VTAVAIKVRDLTAPPGVRPREWQRPHSSSVAPVHWGKAAPRESPELQRILALPRRMPPDLDGPAGDALADVMTEKYGRENAACRCRELAPARFAGGSDGCVRRLRREQAWALRELAQCGGLLGFISVGAGKTLLDVLAPLALLGAGQTALLLCPASLVDQLVDEYRLAAEHFRVPSLVAHGRPFSAIVPGAPALHLLSYHRLQQETATVFLETLRPDLIVADEVDCLRHVVSVRGGRVARYLLGCPQTMFCGWTGSMTEASLRDYAHLALWALRDGSPLPRDPETLSEWCLAVDPSPVPAPPGELLSLCEPGEDVHRAIARRLSETAGVVQASAPGIDAELHVIERRAPPLPDVVAAALKRLRDEWVRPDGEEFVDALPKARCAWQLACGFYYRWRFHGEPVEDIEEWFAARRDWRRELRLKCLDKEPHLDSPKLCALAAMRGWREVPYEGDLPTWRAHTWPRWRRAKNLIQKPDLEPVRLHPFLAEDAAAWGVENRGIVWYAHRDFGAWVSELSGLPLHGGGPGCGERIQAERGDRSIVASVHSHGRGRDRLQFVFCDQLIANPPSRATAFEQLLGRLHRPLQRAPVVSARFYRNTPEVRGHVDTALRRALYIEGTTRARQKLRTGWRVDG
jgi:hypothetical protein